MTDFKEVKISRILNPTSIDLGEYVINPFMGCEFRCLYCYVRSNRVVSRKTEPWGSYVDIRINAPQLLEKELLRKRPRQVLLGSTTECFQPIEKKYGVTGKILEILNKNKIYYVILSRSPHILDYLSLLKAGFCKKIYFTVNDFPVEFKDRLEPYSPGFDLRDETVGILIEEGIPVVPYFSPVLPLISELREVFVKFNKAETIEFEGLNFRLANIDDIINSISCLDNDIGARYKRMITDNGYYAKVFRHIEEDIKTQSKARGRSYNIYIHQFGGYFQNKYTDIQKEGARG
ncbi:MAG: hypothetical protein JW788_07070 [Candidatus Omnitrophica bacterium]|nr:hypothetical protein [Candidatus Omnitrophota bacterium]